MKKTLIGAGVIVAALIAIGVFSQSPNTTISPSNSSTTQNQPAPAPQPKVEVKQETTDEVVPFDSKNVDDSLLAKGQSRVTQNGVNGKVTHYFDVTFTDGKETSRTETKTTKVDPVDQITANGTYVEPSADPYAGASAICADGTPSYSQHRQGTCSHHGGVARWLY